MFLISFSEPMMIVCLAACREKRLKKVTKVSTLVSKTTDTEVVQKCIIIIIITMNKWLVSYYTKGIVAKGE